MKNNKKNGSVNQQKGILNGANCIGTLYKEQRSLGNSVYFYGCENMFTIRKQRRQNCGDNRKHIEMDHDCVQLLFIQKGNFYDTNDKCTPESEQNKKFMQKVIEQNDTNTAFSVQKYAPEAENCSKTLKKPDETIDSKLKKRKFGLETNDNLIANNFDIYQLRKALKSACEEFGNGIVDCFMETLTKKSLSTDTINDTNNLAQCYEGKQNSLEPKVDMTDSKENIVPQSCFDRNSIAYKKNSIATTNNVGSEFHLGNEFENQNTSEIKSQFSNFTTIEDSYKSQIWDLRKKLGSYKNQLAKQTELVDQYRYATNENNTVMLRDHTYQYFKFLKVESQYWKEKELKKDQEILRLQKVDLLL